MTPASTLGILGGGQLGRFLALSARQLGLRSVVLDPVADCPASQAADEFVRAPLEDAKAAADLARRCDVVTLEWELIPLETLKAVEALRPLRPGSRELSCIQDRLNQKRFLGEKDFPQTAFLPVEGALALEPAARRLGYPCLLKRRRGGYDGKGQLRLGAPSDLALAADILRAPCLLEAWTPFEREISVVLARSLEGELAFYPTAENIHEGGILRATLAPARVPEEVERRARSLAGALAEAFRHVGVMAVEFFLLSGGRLLVNEIAPRVHNSGHYTMGACSVSQFEQHVRAAAGLPLGSTEQSTPAVMINLLGELWSVGEPDWKVLEEPGVSLFLYGKKTAAPGRKMGHFLVMGPDLDANLKRGEELLRKLSHQ